MKRMENKDDDNVINTRDHYPVVWQCVLEYCVTQGSLDIVIHGRFVSTRCWTDELALLGCARLLRGRSDNDTGANHNDSTPREKFDRLYKYAYRFVRINDPVSPCLPFKQHHKYEAMGPVTKFSDWDDIKALRKTLRGTTNALILDNKAFDTIQLQFGDDCACVLMAEDERPCDSASLFCYMGDGWLYDGGLGCNNNSNDVYHTQAYEKHKGYDKRYMQQIVGKTLVGLWIVTRSEDDYFTSDPVEQSSHDNAYDFSGGDDHDTRTIHVLVAQDGQQFPFVLYHRSNGYYSGSLHCEWTLPNYLKTMTDSQHQHIRSLSHSITTLYPLAKLIIVVGLPASGKSTYARQRYGGSDTLIFDDDDELEGCDADMHDEYFVQMALRHLLQNKPVCFVSARFCNLAHYRKFITGFPSELMREEMGGGGAGILHTVLFENNPGQCLNNNNERLKQRLCQHDGGDRSTESQARRDRERIDKDIQWLTVNYHAVSANYGACIEHVPVYCAPTNDTVQYSRRLL